MYNDTFLSIIHCCFININLNLTKFCKHLLCHIYVSTIYLHKKPPIQSVGEYLQI